MFGQMVKLGPAGSSSFFALVIYRMIQISKNGLQLKLKLHKLWRTAL